MKTEEKKKPEKEKPAKEAEVVHEPLEIAPHAETRVEVPADFKTKLTKNQVELVKRTIAKGASDDELKMFLYICQRTGLDPFTKQIHLVPRWDSKLGGEIRVPIVGIDGLRATAEKTGAYAGNADPKFGDDVEIDYTETVYEGKTRKERKAKMSVPGTATVTVKKIVQGVVCDFTATARWDQYLPKKKDGSISSPLWIKMPHLMLGKCAEALALRKAFPAVLSGLYVQEEMGQANGGEKMEPRAFDKATMVIAKQTSVEELEKALKNIGGSDKYTLPEKKKIEKQVKDRIAELKKDETNTVPVVHANGDVGEEPANL